MDPDRQFLHGPVGKLEAIYRRVTRERAAVLCHSHPRFGGSMLDRVLHAVACSLHESGVSTLRFNLRGVGASDGRFDGGHGEADDVRCAIDRAAEDHDDVAVVGFSFGAWLGLRVGSEDRRVSRMVGLALPVSGLDVTQIARTSKPTLLVQGERDPCGDVRAARSLALLLGSGTHLEVVAGAEHSFDGAIGYVAGLVGMFLAPT